MGAFQTGVNWVDFCLVNDMICMVYFSIRYNSLLLLWPYAWESERESEQWKNSERKRARDRERARERAGRVVPLCMTHCDDSLKQLCLCSAVIFGWFTPGFFLSFYCEWRPQTRTRLRLYLTCMLGMHHLTRAYIHTGLVITPNTHERQFLKGGAVWFLASESTKGTRFKYRDLQLRIVQIALCTQRSCDQKKIHKQTFG